MTIFFLFFLNIFAQTPNILWQAQYGGTDDDRLLTVAPLENKMGLIAAGLSLSNDFDLPINKGVEDIWVIKTNELGELDWSVVFGGSNREEAKDIIPTNDGGALILGNTNSTDGDFPDTTGQIDACLLKINANGVLEWAKTYGGSLDDLGKSMAILPNGNIVIAGETLSQDGLIEENKGFKDLWLLQVNGENGNVIWSKTYGGSSNDGANSIVFDEENKKIIIAGFSSSKDGDVVQRHDKKECWLLKLDEDGHLLWNQTYGGFGLDSASDVVLTGNGGIAFLAEVKRGDGDIQGEVLGACDLWLAHVNANNGLDWSTLISRENQDFPHGLVQSAEGNLWVVGATIGQQNNNTSTIFNDLLLVELSLTDGTISWQKRIGGSEDDFGMDVFLAADNEIVIAGYTDSKDGDLGETTSDKTNFIQEENRLLHGAHEAWILKMNDITLNTENQLFDKSYLKLYPNPVNTHLNIELLGTHLNKSNKLFIELYTISGQLVLQKKSIVNAKQSNIPLTIPPLKDGMYYLKIHNTLGDIHTEKITIMRK